MKAAVIGAGYAGMAAAGTLAAAGVPVTVLEAGTELGGRARRVRFPDVTVDNGLHILLGAYRETLRLMTLVGQDPERAFVRLPLDWHVANAFRLKTVPLPAPLHLAIGLLMTRGASWMERLAAARFLRAARKSGFRLSADITVNELLHAHRQGEAFRRYLWRPLCAAALNTPPETASGQVFLNVLRDGLDAARDASDVLLARLDLTALFPEPAAAYVRSHGGEVLTRQRVTAIVRNGSGFVVRTASERTHYTHLICAVAPHQVRAVLPQVPELAAVDHVVENLCYQPIYTVYLQFENRVRLSAPMLGLRDGIGQWVFDREAIAGQTALVAVVVSTAGDHQRLTQRVLAEKIVAQLRRELGSLPPLRWYRVIAEKRATFGCCAGVQRPPRAPALPNFFLAGDYTAGDYPATLESAVQSGVACAQALLS